MRRSMFALVLLAAALMPSSSAAQQLRVRPKLQHPLTAVPLLRALQPHALGPIALATVNEAEPNDSIPIATAVTLGDTVSGFIDPADDVDFYGFDLTEGTVVELDVDAAAFGSQMDPVLWLLLGDSVIAYSDDEEFYILLDSKIEFRAPTTGRYYAAIADYYGRGGPGYFYSLKIVPYVPPPPPPPGPGDPTTVFAQGFSWPTAMAAADNGDFYVADGFDHSRVARVSATGTVSTFVSNIALGDLVVDSYGDLLVAAGDSGVYRLTPAGVKSRFLSGFFSEAITVDEGGDVWVGGETWTGLGSRTIEIRRYNARGIFKSSIDVTAMYGMGRLAFGPTGELYATNVYDGVFRVTPAGVTRVITTRHGAADIAFDQDGYLYVELMQPAEIDLYDPSFQPVAQSFANTHLGAAIVLAFGRSSTGEMTSRLFTANGANTLEPEFSSTILEMNPAAMRAPGFRIGTTRPQMSEDAVIDAILGDSAAISAEVAHFLDLQGNRNGRLDVGDFRAYLRTLPAPSATAGRMQP